MDELNDFRHTMQSCNHCGQCKWILGPKMRGWDFAEVCPIHQRFHYDAYSGQGLLNIAQELLEGTLSYEPGLVDLIYSCTTCGACELNCKSVRDMEVIDTILALRTHCVAGGHGPLPEHRSEADNVARTKNIYGLPHEERFAWLGPAAGDPPVAGREPAATDVTEADDGKTIYFVGCATAYRYPETARNIMRILAAGGVDFELLGPGEVCCGATLWRTGQSEAFAASVRRNLEVLRRHGAKRVITGCAECYGTFRGGYPRVEQMDDIEIVHISEVIDRLLDQKRLPLKDTGPDRTLTYHDPCLLARLGEKYVPWQGEIKPYGLHEPPKEWRRGANGVYDAPRRVLRSLPGLELVEMVRNQECGYCCGAGGGVAAACPELAAWIADERLREARSTGADGLVSCCPFCRESLGHDDSLPYHDLADLVAGALADGEGSWI